MNRKLWLITDTHFNHAKLSEWGERPPDFDRIIESNWRRLVSPQDTLIHLGDVIFSKAGELGDIMGRLPGTKILVLGNHDTRNYSWYLSHGFAAVMDGMLYDRVWLTHYPQQTLPDGALLNVHGHLHANEHRADCQTYPHCKLLAIERTGLSPVEFKKFVGPLAGDSLSRTGEGDSQL